MSFSAGLIFVYIAAATLWSAGAVVLSSAHRDSPGRHAAAYCFKPSGVSRAGSTENDTKRRPGLRRRRCSSAIFAVISGQTVVHREKKKFAIQTWPRRSSGVVSASCWSRNENDGICHITGSVSAGPRAPVATLAAAGRGDEPGRWGDPAYTSAPTTTIAVAPPRMSERRAVNR